MRSSDLWNSVPRCVLKTSLGVIEAELKLAGAHNVVNAAAAVAAAIGAGIGADKIAAGLEKNASGSRQIATQNTPCRR